MEKNSLIYTIVVIGLIMVSGFLAILYSSPTENTKDSAGNAISSVTSKPALLSDIRIVLGKGNTSTGAQANPSTIKFSYQGVTYEMDLVAFSPDGLQALIFVNGVSKSITEKKIVTINGLTFQITSLAAWNNGSDGFIEVQILMPNNYQLTA